MFYFTTCGWMMWNWLVSALATGATVVLYDGAPLWAPSLLWDMSSREFLARGDKLARRWRASVDAPISRVCSPTRRITWGTGSQTLGACTR